jgi:hypothetical protein
MKRVSLGSQVASVAFAGQLQALATCIEEINLLGWQRCHVPEIPPHYPASGGLPPDQQASNISSRIPCFWALHDSEM